MAEMGLIRGYKPRSKNEWYVSLALEKYKLDYQYQVPIDRGRQRRGGQVIDFVVYNPFPMAVPVMGEYWHKGQLDSNERFKIGKIEQKFGKNRVVILWGSETSTYKDALFIVRKKLLFT